MSKLLVCPRHLECDQDCAHNKPHEAIYLTMHNKQENYCKLVCDVINNNTQCCEPISTRWDK